MRIRLKNPFHSPDPEERLLLEQDIEEELRFHLEMRQLEHETEGMNSNEAEKTARDRFGDVERIQAQCLAIKTDNPFSYILKSTQLMGGIALTSGILCLLFLIINAVHFRLPLTYQGDGEWAAIWWQENQSGQTSVSSYRNYKSLQEQQTSFEFMTAVLYRFFFVGSDTGPPQRVQAKLVSPDYFKLHGGDPILGSSFEPADFEVGPHVPIILSYEFWSRRFGKDPEVIHKSLTVNGKEATIVGVTPPRFRMYYQTDIFLPLRFGMVRNPENRFLLLSGKPRDGVSLEAATQELRQLTAYESSRNLILRSVNDVYGSPVRPTLIAYLGLAFMVLVLVCVHFARRHLYMPYDQLQYDLQTRGFKKMMIDYFPAVVLAVAAGMLGSLVLVNWALPYFTGNFSHLYDVQVDRTVVGFGIGLVVFVGLLVCIIPWLLEKLRRRGPLAALSVRGLYSSFSVIEIAFAFMMCVIAGLLIREAWDDFKQHPGYNAEDVLAVSLTIPQYRLQSQQDQAQFMRDVFQKIDSLDGVKRASLGTLLPDQVSTNQMGVFSQSPEEHAPKHEFFTSHVGVDYMQLFGIPLHEGRYFTLMDIETPSHPVIINQAMAELYWPGENPIGKKMYMEYPSVESEIVGVVGNVIAPDAAQKAHPMVYQFYWSRAWPELQIILKTGVPPATMVTAVKEAIWSLDSEIPIQEATWLPQEQWNRHKNQQRSLFGLLTLALFGFLIASHSVIYGIRQSIEWRIYQIKTRGSSKALLNWARIFQAQLALILAGTLTGLVASHLLIVHYLNPVFGLELIGQTNLALIASFVGLCLIGVALASSARCVSLEKMVSVGAGR